MLVTGWLSGVGLQFPVTVGVELFQDCAGCFPLAWRGWEGGREDSLTKSWLPPGVFKANSSDSAAHCWWNVFVKVASLFDRHLIHFFLGIKNSNKRILPLLLHSTQGWGVSLYEFF